jgi:hypothetical protein
VEIIAYQRSEGCNRLIAALFFFVVDAEDI